MIRCLQADRWRIVSASDDKTIKVWSHGEGEGEAETSETEESSVQIDKWFSAATQKKAKKTIKPKVKSLHQNVKSKENLSKVVTILLS